MCLVLPSRVLSVLDESAEIELPDGQHARVDVRLVPDVRVGEYVLVDRGLALRVIDAAEAEVILAMYAEMGDLMSEGQELPEWATEPARG
jgi:hydrogenase expression/formation protein HypC